MDLSEYARQLEIDNCLEFTPEILVPENRIRGFCLENRCGNYGHNYMCPPHTGSLDEIKLKLGEFKHGMLFQYSKNIDVKGNWEGVTQTKKEFSS